ncbi:putative mitochondrial import inner membrane translocase subunit tim54 [Xylogone sp. PMI_703]|nr:putative mitochondrial import inner membrane translocase subunit tim54 [Xylogone sp. PMI_703]
MADSNPSTEASKEAATARVDIKTEKPSKPPRAPNPIYKYLGLGENFRPRLPSRNWLIFLSITGSFTAAVIYDKREKKRVQRKWCKLVEHVAKEPLDPRSMPRKLTIFLESPPSDSLRAAQDHFKEYVKPVLVASGLDWEFIQGRNEGDVRAELAAKIRTLRTPPEERGNQEDSIKQARRKAGIKDFEGPAGDIVIGRHTWKEYIRGLHEGWLGPLTEPEQTPQELPFQETDKDKGNESQTETSPKDGETPPEPAPPAEDKNKKPPKPAPFISTAEYSSASLPNNIPSEFDPSTPISFPHILGFLNTPRRLYRFLNRRVLADSIGRETAAIILASYRPYHSIADSSSSFDSNSPQKEGVNQEAEQQMALVEEEKEWHKSTRLRKDGEPERTWLEPIVLDPRISSRMRRFELSPEDEARSREIVVSEEEIEGWIKGSIRKMIRHGLETIGYKKKDVNPPIEADEEAYN